LVSNLLGGARLSLNQMSASNINLDAAIQYSFSGSGLVAYLLSETTLVAQQHLDKDQIWSYLHHEKTIVT
jgi:hypothetical protein